MYYCHSECMLYVCACLLLSCSIFRSRYVLVLKFIMTQETRFSPLAKDRKTKLVGACTNNEMKKHT